MVESDEETDPEAPAVLSISDGTTLEVVYDKEGMWRITPRRTGEGTTVSIVTADDPDENYSDRVTMTSEKPFAWMPADGNPTTTSPVSTREPSITSSRSTIPTQVAAKSSSPSR